MKAAPSYIDQSVRTVRQRPTAVVTVLEPFGVVDSKGREIGALIRTFEIAFVDAPAGASSFTWVKPGSYFAAYCHATRDGSTFGALQPDRLFLTAAERDADVAKYLVNARKAALKKPGARVVEGR